MAVTKPRRRRPQRYGRPLGSSPGQPQGEGSSGGGGSGGGGGSYPGTVTSIAPPTSGGGGGGSSPSPTTVTAATASPGSAYPTAIPTTVPSSQNTEPLRALLAGEPVGGGQTLERLLQAGGERERDQVTVGVPEIVPPRYRKAVAKHGQRLNQPLAEAGVDMTGPEYLARLIEFESGWSKTAENPSSAFGFGQFIDSTAQDFRERLGIETQDPSRPTQMIKGASLHAGGDVGYNPLYAGYNPGYSSTDPIPGVPAGKNVPVKVSRKAVERVSGGDIATGSATTKQPGVYAGSRKIVKELLGPYAQTQDWQDKEDRGDPGGTLHDIGTANAFAADVDPDEAIVDRIARKLGLDPKEVNYGTTGLESGQTYKGYDIEFLPYTHGSGPHTHIGAEWTGGSPPEGTTLGAPGGTAYGGAADTTSAATTAGVGMASGDRFGAAAEQRTAAAISPISNPLSARAAMPSPFGAPTGVDEDDPLSALLRPDDQTASDEDDLVQILERFRPKRRLG